MKLDKPSKGSEMSVSAQFPQMMHEAYPPRLHDNRKAWLSAFATWIGWGQRRTKALFYCEARVVTADEWRTLNERLDAAKKRERETHELRTLHRGVGEAVPAASRDLPAALPFEAGKAGAGEVDPS